MNISQAVIAIITASQNTPHELMDTSSYRRVMANILQKLIDDRGVGTEYLEKEVKE